jgi:Y_Y_Y domain
VPQRRLLKIDLAISGSASGMQGWPAIAMVGSRLLAFDPGAALRFQYKLDGTDSWSPPTEARNVTYPPLAAGTYRLLVRGVSSDGRTSPTPASLTFAIPAPLWARWWFLTALASVMVWAVHAAYRYRISRLLEIERIRTGLAMDLHDDIGSTLSQVAVLSEVARARVDSVRDLQQRMRRFASDTLDAQNIRLRFDAPSEDLNVRLDPHVRREVFLIFKETINNLRRYANCTRAAINFSDPRLIARSDDRGRRHRCGSIRAGQRPAIAQHARTSRAAVGGPAIRLCPRTRYRPAPRRASPPPTVQSFSGAV